MTGATVRDTVACCTAGMVGAKESELTVSESIIKGDDRWVLEGR